MCACRRFNPVSFISRFLSEIMQKRKVFKRIGLLIIILVVILSGFLLFRTTRFTSKQVSVQSVPLAVKDQDTTARHLASALQFQTISILEADQFRQFHEFLKATYPKVFATLTLEKVNEHSLLFRWEGRAPNLKPILLVAHQDVVPVEPGTEDNWTHPPFGGHIADGYVWGRGSLDDKSGVIGILEAAELLLSEGFQPQRTMYFAFGHDEETSGKQGAAEISKVLQSRGLQFECVLDEGGAVVEDYPQVPLPVALVGIAEKGYVSIKLTAKGEGGHSSMPPKQTAVGILSAALVKLETNQVPARLEGPTRQMFEYLGPEMSFPNRVIMANLWLFRPLVQSILAKAPTTNAYIRTTTAPTMLEGSIKDNVLPISARAIINFRILPGDTIDSVTRHVRQTVNDPRVDVEPLTEMAANPSPTSRTDSEAFATVQRTLHQVFPGIVVTPTLVIGATDGRYYASLSQNVYRFLPIWIKQADTVRIHGTNERVSVKNFAQAVTFYRQLMVNFDGKTSHSG